MSKSVSPIEGTLTAVIGGLTGYVAIEVSLLAAAVMTAVAGVVYGARVLARQRSAGASQE